ncbi:Hypothetical Protein FCC1311_071752 [Hondaea fermentalgiana]|uniref:PWI domain-containing protein n=1 Tax=Hondaea fermentalgiana TaxID=2315210 RepID=A0A2R5GSU9_9STRA|nr:Hypothetical Protein FCC1311_071752 [Hondaea fermentalgiana]|eukprot:GBG30954.1 Hypothetical Protein FCC1311_071752 [Hondaea fermentalgiana]
MVLVFVNGLDARVPDARVDSALIEAVGEGAKWHRVRAADDGATTSGFAELASAKDAALLTKSMAAASQLGSIEVIPEANAATECERVAEELEADVVDRAAKALVKELAVDETAKDAPASHSSRNEISQTEIEAALRLDPKSESMSDEVYKDISDFRYAQARREVAQDRARKRELRQKVANLRKERHEANEARREARAREEAARAADADQKLGSDEVANGGTSSTENVPVKMHLKKAVKGESAADDILGHSGGNGDDGEPAQKRLRSSEGSFSSEGRANESHVEPGTANGSSSGNGVSDTHTATEALQSVSPKVAEPNLEAEKVRTVASKLIENYFGVPEPTLVEHLVRLVCKGAERDELIAEVQAVLEEDEAKECIDALLREVQTL